MGRLSAARSSLQPAASPGAPPVQRGSARQRGYSPKWGRTSRGYLRKHPLCLGFLALGMRRKATVTDHIVPHKGDAGLFWDRDNWQPASKWMHDNVKQRLELLFARDEIEAEELRLDSKTATALARQLLAKSEAKP